MRNFVSITSIAAVLLAVLACKKQDQPSPESPQKINDLEYIMGGLVRTDDAGTITGYMIGDNLNEANPNEISVPVETYDEAAAIFRELLPVDAQVTTSGKTITWVMTDENGKPEGTTVFSESSDPGIIAQMTISPENQTKARHRKIDSYFIPRSAWPENAGSAKERLEREFFLGAVVYKSKDEGFGSGEYLVIRPWTEQACGIMIQMYPEIMPYVPGYARSSMNTLHNVSKALNENSWLVEGYGKHKNWPSLDNLFISVESTLYGSIGFVNLKTDQEKWGWVSIKEWGHVYVYCFKPKGNSIKYW